MDFFLFARLEIGSSDIVRGRGGPKGPTSTLSTSSTFLSHIEVAAIVVGRVIVEEI